MVIYNERLVKFQGYNEGTFYILRQNDIKEFINTEYKDLDNKFQFRKNTKDMFLFEKRLNEGIYFIIHKYDFKRIKKMNLNYGDTLEQFKICNRASWTDFKYINTVYVIGKYIQERFIADENITLPVCNKIQNEYMEEYIKATPFFKAFTNIETYYFRDTETYYLKCEAIQGTTKFEFLFDIPTLKELFRKYQSPDYEPFDLQLLKENNKINVLEETESTENEEAKNMKDSLAFVNQVRTTETISTKTGEVISETVSSESTKVGTTVESEVIESTAAVVETKELQTDEVEVFADATFDNSFELDNYEDEDTEPSDEDLDALLEDESAIPDFCDIMS